MAGRVEAELYAAMFDGLTVGQRLQRHIGGDA